MKSQLLITTIVTLWLFVCAFLTAQLIAFGARPGEKAQTAKSFPQTTKLKLTKDKFTVVAFLHPQCPCSKATIGELEEFMGNHGDDSTAYALFLKPVGCNEEFARSELFEQSSRIKGVQTIVDNDGLEAKIFGSKTSGQVMVYDPRGCLVFSGGITSSRGHYGDNDGLDAVCNIVQKKEKSIECSEVYGCPLFASTTEIASDRR